MNGDEINKIILEEMSIGLMCTFHRRLSARLTDYLTIVQNDRIRNLEELLTRLNVKIEMLESLIKEIVK